VACPPAALQLIESFERFRRLPYDDGYGYMTVGWGHVIRPGEDWSRGITRYQADALLERDLAKAERAVALLLPIPLNDNQRGAMISFTFNAGAGALQRSTFRQCMLRGDFGDVPAGMMLYCKAGRPLRISAGLQRRRAAEVKLFQAG